MNTARLGSSVACLAGRRAGLAAPRQGRASNKAFFQQGQGQVMNQSNSGKRGKGVVEMPPKKLYSTKSAAPPADAAAATPELPTAGNVLPATRRMNWGIGAVLMAAVGASYMATMKNMDGQDFLNEVEKEAEEEAQVNLHNNELKISSKVIPEVEGATKEPDIPGEIASKIRKVEEEISEKIAEIQKKASEESAEVIEKMSGDVEPQEAALEEAEGKEKTGEKKKGWRKYIVFGPRVGGG